jgi:hypothetical protein
MAHLVFFFESLQKTDNPAFLCTTDLVEHLAENQHEITVLSLFDRDHPHHQFRSSRIRTLFPFKNWGFFELTKLLPFLFKLRPDLVYHVSPLQQPKRSLWDTRLALAQMVKHVLGVPYIISDWSFDPQEDVQNQKQVLLEQADLILVANRLQQKCLTDLPFLKGSGKVVDLELHMASPANVSVSPFWASDSFENYIFLNSTLDKLMTRPHHRLQLFRVLLQNPNTGLIAPGWGSLSPRHRKILLQDLSKHELSHRFLVAEPESENERRDLIMRARCIWLAHNLLSDWQWLHDLPLALRLNTIPVLTPSQVQLTSYNWKEGQHFHLSTTPFLQLENPTPCDNDELQSLLNPEHYSQLSNHLSRLF